MLAAREWLRGDEENRKPRDPRSMGILWGGVARVNRISMHRTVSCTTLVESYTRDSSEMFAQLIDEETEVKSADVTQTRGGRLAFSTVDHTAKSTVQWFPGGARVRPADARTLGVGKYFQILFEVPLIGEWKAYFTTTDYKRGKLLAVESNDGIINPRFELRTDNYHDKSFLQVTMYLQKSSAVFQYTVGSFVRSITKRKFEETMGRIEEMYKSTDKYRELT